VENIKSMTNTKVRTPEYFPNKVKKERLGWKGGRRPGGGGMRRNHECELPRGEPKKKPLISRRKKKKVDATKRKKRMTG